MDVRAEMPVFPGFLKALTEVLGRDIRANDPWDIRPENFLSSRAAKRGGFQTGGFPDLDLSFLFCHFWDFPDFSGIFPICSGMVWGFSRFVLFLFLGLLRAPTRNSPERVRDTIWTFPRKSGKPPGLETPRFSFSQSSRVRKGGRRQGGPRHKLS